MVVYDWKNQWINGMSDGEDFYRVLGVPSTATQNEIKKAHKRLARLFHEDRTQSVDSNEASENRSAFTVLFLRLNFPN